MLIKRLSILFLTALLLLNATGWMAFFLYREWNIHQYMEEKIKRTPLDLLTKIEVTDLSTITWMNEHEVSINGKMFDVMKVVKTTPGVVLYGLSDEEESALKMQWRSVQSSAESQSIMKSFVGFLSLLYLVSPRLTVSHHITHTIHFTAYQPSISTPIFELVSPPPRVFFHLF